ncbi:MAG TPA: hypothetical protein VFP72_12295 [Kineosporiaceae bacterium]|nr:hypothetical protein [Kineosporiaceae bacterium]
MPVRIRGVVDGVPFDVEVTGDPASPTVGSRRVAALLASRAGSRARVGPTEPAPGGESTEVRRVLAVLAEHGQVLSVSGLAPDAGGRPPIPHGAVS